MPPLGPTALGVALTVSCVAAAAPTRISSASAWAPPENARICATPDAVPASSRTVALPPLVRASAGWMLPSVVVKLTCVPFCTGTPPGSVTLAVISTEPLRATTVWLAKSVTAESVGAVNGALSHPTSAPPSTASVVPRAARRASARRNDDVVLRC